jgi:hypothetical protein
LNEGTAGEMLLAYSPYAYANYADLQCLGTVYMPGELPSLHLDAAAAAVIPSTATVQERHDPREAVAAAVDAFFQLVAVRIHCSIPTALAGP